MQYEPTPLEFFLALLPGVPPQSLRTATVLAYRHGPWQYHRGTFTRPAARRLACYPSEIGRHQLNLGIRSR